MADLIFVRPLTPDDVPEMLPLLNEALGRTRYSASLDATSASEMIFSVVPETVHEVEWREHLCAGAWLSDKLVGLADLACISVIPLHQALVHRSEGLMRFFCLTDHVQGDLLEQVAKGLLSAANHFFENNKVQRVRAFDPDLGYPSFQSGIGLLPGEWFFEIQFLTAAGFRLQDRFYCMHRQIVSMLEEVTPMTGLSLVHAGNARDRRYQLYLVADQVGEARLVHRQIDSPVDDNPVGHIAAFEIFTGWRGAGIGDWFLRRIINDATLQGYQRLLIRLHTREFTALSPD